MDDRQKFAEIMVGIAEVYGKDMSEAGLSVWWSALSRYSTEQVTNALNSHVQDAERGQWMPKPGDIVRQIDGTPDDAAVAAWAKVDHALRSVGGGPSWVFDDPKIHRAVDQVGGVAVLSNCPTEKDLTFLREQFCKRYASPHNAGPYPKKLAGWLNGSDPVFIGDPEKCQAVLDGGGNERPKINNAAEAGMAMIEDMRGSA